MSSLATKKVQKSSVTHTCEICDYTSSRQSQYARHLETAKHLKRINSTKLNAIMTKSSTFKFGCDLCSKTYKERTGLWRHKKTCVYEAPPPPAPPLVPISSGYIKDPIIEILINENKDFALGFFMEKPLS